MATFTSKITESITLDSGTVNSENTLTIASITDVCKRTVTIGTNETGLLGFATAGNTDLAKSYVVGQFDEDEVMYIRITNLDGTNHIALVLKNENDDEFGVKVDKGQSFIYNGDLAGGVKDTMDSADAAGITPNSFGDLVDITCTADSGACLVEVMVASEAAQ